MKNNKQAINFTELKKVLHDIGQNKLLELLKKYDIQCENKGRETFYLIDDISTLKKDLEERYEFNKMNRIEVPELIILGIPNPSILFKKKAKEPLDRIYEFKFGTYFYDRKEVDDFLLERETVKESLGIKDIQNELGLTHYKAVKEIISITQTTPIKLKYFTKLKYYRMNDIKKIKKLQEEQYEFNKKNRLTYQQILDFYNLNPHDIWTLEAIKTTALDRVNEFSKCNYFYDKSQVLEYLDKTNVNFETYTSAEAKKVLQLYDSTLFSRYLKRLKITSIILNGSSQNHWDKNAIDAIAKKKEALLEIYNNKFLTIAEFEANFVVTFAAVQRAFEKINQEIKYYEIPLEIKLGKYSKVQMLLAYEDIDYILEILINNTTLTNHSEIVAKREALQKDDKLKLINLDHERQNSFNFSLIDLDHKRTQEFIDYIEIPDLETLKKEMDKLITNKRYRSDYLISKEQIAKKYNISLALFKLHRDLNYDKLKFIKKSTLTFYAVKDIENLFAQLISLQKELLSKHYTSNDLNKMDLDYTKYSTIGSIEVPLRLRFGLFEKSISLYPKIEADKKIQELRLKHYLLGFKSHDELSLLPSKVYEEIIVTLKSEFNMCQHDVAVNQTFILWQKYVKKRLDNSHGNKASIYGDMIILVRLTHLFSEKIKNKNLFLWTINEIEENLFKGNISKSWLLVILAFLSFINSKRITKYKSEELAAFRKKIVAVDVPRETSTFTTDEFIALINFVKDVPYHKNKAIKEMLGPKKGKRKYYEYASVWLYVLMHLNNAWRSTDIIEKIPRISLPSSIDSIDKFRNYELSVEEIKSILFELSGKLLDIHHNKNLKQAYFFCAEKLEEPFVNALVLCELKCRLEKPLAHNLVHLDDNKNLSKSLHDTFFQGFDVPSFTFSSLKANRSYIKILKAVLNHLSSDDVMTILELQRNHGSLDVTKRYTPINTDDANTILKNLYSVGYFGHTYTLLTKMLLGKQGQNVTTEAIKLLKEVFGDIYKVENFITQINSIEKTNYEVVSYLEKLNANELENLFGLISLGQKPSKEEHWQCILGDCIYSERDCGNCPFAIPNYYVLNSVLKKLNKHIDDYQKYFALGIQSELVKSSKLIHRYLLILSSAKKKFGEVAISSFLGYEYTVFKKKLSTLADFKYYLYLRGNYYEQ